MLAYEELKGSSGREIWFRAPRYQARQLFPHLPPRVRVHSSLHKLHDLSIGGIGVGGGGNVTGLAIGGVGVGGGGNFTGIGIAGVGIGGGGNATGLMIGGIGVGSGGTIRGVARDGGRVGRASRLPSG